MKNVVFNQQAKQLSLITQKYLVWIFAIYILLLILSSRVSDCDMNNPVALISANGYKLQVELAVHDKSRRCGLSLRHQLASDHGMLFVFDQNQILSFWMKDTRIPLSIAFLTTQGDILNIHTMQPMNDTLYYHSAGLARYALEVNQGWFSDHGLQAGDRIQLVFVNQALHGDFNH